MTGIQLEEKYSSQFRGAFPYADCQHLAALERQPVDDLIPQLDLYFSNIAGYSSSAAQLLARPADALRKAKETLGLDFFESHPALERYRKRITRDEAPKLFRQMRVAEELRLGLLKILENVE